MTALSNGGYQNSADEDSFETTADITYDEPSEILDHIPDALDMVLFSHMGKRCRTVQLTPHR
jgi:hypothetical protein